MDIKITAKNIKLTPAIKEYINTRVSKVENFFDNIVSAQVKEQYCIGTWNVRSMNQGKLEVVKQEMASECRPFRNQ